MAPVNSGVSQGSVFGTLHFIIFINDVYVKFNNLISKFADDTKIGNSVLTDEDRQSLQEGLHESSAWSDGWEMVYNVDMCQVLQVGARNMKFDYEMRGVKLRSVQYVKDMAIKIASNLKFSPQCIDAANKANRMVGFIKKKNLLKNRYVILRLYIRLVRPHLEHAVQLWSPHLAKDTAKLGVQRLATKMIPSLSNKS